MILRLSAEFEQLNRIGCGVDNQNVWHGALMERPARFAAVSMHLLSV